MSERLKNQTDYLIMSAILNAGADGVTVGVLTGLVARLYPNVNAKHLNIHVGHAVARVRQSLVDDVIVYDDRLRVYRMAIDLADAETYRRKATRLVFTRVANSRRYMAAEAGRFGLDTVQHSLWKVGEDNLRAAESSIEAAARLSFGHL